jgi:hypothetical protein
MAISVANITTAASNAYVSSGNTAVTWLSLCNYSASNVTANIYVVPSGNLAGNSTLIVTGIELTSNGVGTGDTYQIYTGNEKLILANGDTIQVDASANSAITAITSYTSI